MRTTLDIDEDVLLAAKEAAKREHRTAGQVISDLARRALNRRVGDVGASSSFYGFRPLPQRDKPVSNGLINRLREDEPV